MEKTSVIPKLSEIDEYWNLKTDIQQHQTSSAETEIYNLMAKK